MIKNIVLLSIVLVLLSASAHAFRVTMGTPYTFRGYTLEMLDCSITSSGGADATLVVYKPSIYSYNYTGLSIGDNVALPPLRYEVAIVSCGYTYATKYIDLVLGRPALLNSTPIWPH